MAACSVPAPKSDAARCDITAGRGQKYLLRKLNQQIWLEAGGVELPNTAKLYCENKAARNNMGKINHTSNWSALNRWGEEKATVYKRKMRSAPLNQILVF